MNHLSRLSRLLLAVISLIATLIPFIYSTAAQAAPLQQTSSVTINLSLQSGEAVVSPGETVAFEIEVLNTGRSPVDNAEIRVTYNPAALSPADFQVNNGRGWQESSPVVENGVITWEGDSLAPNQPWRARYNGTVTQPLPVNRVDSQESGSPTRQVTSQAAVLVNGAQVSQSVLSLSVPLPAGSLEVRKIEEDGKGIGTDGMIRLTLEVANTSRDILYSNLRVVESFKASAAQPDVQSLEILDSSLVQGSPPVEIIEDQVYWQVDRIAPGSSWYVTYQLSIDPKYQAGNREVVNTAVVLMDSSDGEIPVAESDPLTLKVFYPSLVLSREITSEKENGEFRPGDTVHYKLTYSNLGSGSASDVVIIETVQSGVFEEALEINNSGQKNGNRITWRLGTLPVGAVGEVSYDAVIKKDLYSSGNDSADPRQVSNRAVIQIEDLPEVKESGSQTIEIQAPVLRIAGMKIEDLNGGDLLPGDMARVTIDLANQGAVTASAVVLRGLYDKSSGVIQDISDGGIAGDGFIEWRINELPAGAEKRLSYDLLINAEPERRVDSLSEAILSLDGVDVARASRTMTIQPIPLPTPTPMPAPSESSVFEQKNFEWMAILIGGLTMVSLAVVSYQAWALKHQDHFEEHFRDIVEMFTIIIIVAAVLILAMVSEIGSTPAVGVLSGIAGYVLGRGAKR